jgi:hypothetical protein
MSRKIVNTNIRLNLEREDDHRAWEYLQRMDRKRYKSYSRAVVAAVNDYFDRHERLAVDPYLETREKEDAFLRRVQETIERGLQAASPVNGLLQLLNNAQPAAPPPEDSIEQEAANAAAMDFVNSF